jgi:periplasmic protein TonB
MGHIRHNIIFSVMVHSILLAAALLIGGSSEIRKAGLFTVSFFDETEKSLPPEQAASVDVKQNARAMVTLKAAMRTITKLSAAQEIISKQDLTPLAPVKPQSATDRDSVPGVMGIETQSNSSHMGGDNPSSVGSRTARSSSGEAGDNTASVLRGQTDQATEPGADASLKQRIRDALQANLIYPYIARKRGMEGTVHVEFLINSVGLPENIRIMKGSGYLVLDSAARETIIKASPFPYKNSVIDVPITYQLTQRTE